MAQKPEFTWGQERVFYPPGEYGFARLEKPGISLWES